MFSLPGQQQVPSEMQLLVRQHVEQKSLKAFLRDPAVRSVLVRFEQIRVRSKVFAVGDYCELVPPLKTQVRLKGIFLLERCVPFCEVALVAKKGDLPLPREILASLGDGQLFETDVLDVIAVDLLQNKLSVVPLEEYESGEEQYFSRASFEKGRLEPPFQSWERLCVCNSAHNPDLEYVQCDFCDGWFHQSCMGVGSDIELADKFKCLRCQAS